MQRRGSLNQRLLNDYQRGFPLLSEPFAHIARELGTSADVVISRLQSLQAAGAVSRVGPVFRPNTVGASTLAAMAVPPVRLEETAETVNAFAEVNHNYEREHRFNLWFVVTAADEAGLKGALERTASATGYEVLSLPLEQDYHIDLGFHMSDGACASRTFDGHARTTQLTSSAGVQDSSLISAIQGGLALCERPFDVVARQIGQSESQVIERIQALLRDGTIKRFGVVVRHHELGYRANAMAVWDVPDERVDELGRQLGGLPWVTLCYRRRRHRPQWTYNLYCMIHGRERDAVCRRIERIVQEYDMAGCAHAVLFSQRRFKQRGAYYRALRSSDAQAEVHGHA